MEKTNCKYTFFFLDNKIFFNNLIANPLAPTSAKPGKHLLSRT